jgi:integral membrane protein
MTIGLRYSAIAEALTLLTLVFIAVPLKYWAGFPVATKVMGPVHGLTFLFFLWFVARTWAEGLINWKAATRLFVGAMIPFGGIVNERWLRAQSAAENG